MLTFDTVPSTPDDLIRWSWSDIEPLYDDLLIRPLTAETVADWLSDWTQLCEVVEETEARLFIATTTAIQDEQVQERYRAFLEATQPQTRAADQRLRQKLLASHLEPAGFEVPLRTMRADAALFHEANLPLLAQLGNLAAEYSQRISRQTVEWEDKPTSISQLGSIYGQPDRAQRERAWRLTAARQRDSRDAISALWIKMLAYRRQLATNAGLPDYRAYRWQELHRFDYTLEDCQRLHQSIEAVAVPAITRLYERRRQALGLSELRPWDIWYDPFIRPPLQPFDSAAQLEDGVARLFEHIHPQFADDFAILRREHLLDLAPRQGKSTLGGGYSVPLRRTKRSFIFLNATGRQLDLQTLVHEAGHAFHAFETHRLPYFQQREPGLEFRELVAITLELLASLFLSSTRGGFYSEVDAAYIRTRQLERMLLLLPQIALIDAFQHWAYENPDEAANPEACDAMWLSLVKRFSPHMAVDGLEAEVALGWQQSLLIHTQPFYQIEYALAQIGALQVFRKAQNDASSAIEHYRQAMALGNTLPLPALYQAVGAFLIFDETALGETVEYIKQVLEP